jgi:MOSC domain-containing protein YiiM
MNPSKVIAVCISQEKHTKKKNIGKGVLRENYGIIGDAHSDSSTHRQISLLAIESIEKMRELSLNVHPGDFAENITTEGIDLVSLPLDTKILIGETILQVTQIGKECHNPCAIGQQVGDCIMPREGIFARVINGGKIKIGDEIRLLKIEI